MNFLSKNQKAEKHSEILKHLDIVQHIEKPKRSGKKLIDLISLDLTKVTSQNVLPCGEISNHNAPYVIVNIWKWRFEPHYQHIRDE